MLFTVGPYRYSVRIAATESELQDKIGLPASADIDYEKQIITIAQRFPLERRVDELCYCLSLIWDRHFGTPDSANTRAAQRATFAIDFWRQIDRQGGVAALVRLGGSNEGAAFPEAAADVVPPPAFGTECPDCGGKIAEGSIKNGERRVLNNYNCRMYAIRRSTYCEHCGVTIHWDETLNAAWRPSGTVIGMPRVTGKSAH